ncbi:hypothetical protein GETHLI_30630 [Geothrix limicola]|uniref:Peptidase A2 domain-containing protein n=2 Tax=Geothrix limicola TaxID=2927978 RepID=A0ABQ5QJQ6_9BACT|nr:hypothetical protein GETHLI_30630 [Geothrix limicola]
MNRFYRGERIEATIERSNAGIKAYNAHVLSVQAETERERAKLDKLLAAIEDLRGKLRAMDLEIKQQPAGVGYEATKRKVDARNALVRQINEETTAARPFIDAYNDLVRRTQLALDQERKKAMGTQDAVNARLAAYSAFTKSGEDVAFFLDLNRVLAEARQGLREHPGDSSLQALVDRARAFRRELATWVMEGQALKPNGLVIVEALAGDEPCWFIVDTGAMDTIVSEEILKAIGQGQQLGKETSLSVVGGMRVTGLACRIPRLSVAGQALSDVVASAVRPSDVGIDGLLGQSFLKLFVYTIDERLPAKLILTRRSPESGTH